MKNTIRWSIVLLPCLPYLGLFAPFTMMREDYHPWYIGYTSHICFLAMLYYLPANAVAHAVTFFLAPAESVDDAIFLVICIVQSLLLSFLVWRILRNRDVPVHNSRFQPHQG